MLYENEFDEAGVRGNKAVIIANWNYHAYCEAR